jgi:hypothetical protein
VTFKEASFYEIQFGKYRGMKLDSIASDDEGLRYLRWLFGEMEDDEDKIDTPVYKALDAYLSDPAIQSE